MPNQLRFSMTWAASLALVFAFAAAPASAAADDSDRINALEEQVKVLMGEIQKMKAEKEAEAAVEDVTVAPNPELQENIGVLAREMERIKRAVAIPEETGLKSMYGKGPAASKVYTKDQGLSIGGYGEGYFDVNVKDKHGRNNVSEWLRGVLYAGYKFNDWIVVNTEIEFEHASTGRGGSASVEFAELDFFLDERANVAVGLLLTPMGFINEIHEPTEYYGVSRPSPERQIIPSTWREMGAGLFGSFLDDTLSYKVYAMNGLDAAGFSSSGYRGGRQKGRARLANDWAFVGRVDWIPVEGLLVGGSVWTGGSGQNQTVGGIKLGDVWTTIFEFHAEYEWQGLFLRALYTQSHIGNSGQLSEALGETIATRSRGGYAEAAYNVLPWIFPGTEMRLEPFYRFEWTETQNKVPDGFQANLYDNFRVNTVGLQFYPHPQVVIKVDYRNEHALGRNSDGNQRPDKFQMGVGYVF